MLQQPRLAAIFAACAWAYRDATTATQRCEHLGGMYSIALLLVVDWRFPFEWAMRALYEAATGIESQLGESREIIEQAVGNLDFFS